MEESFDIPVFYKGKEELIPARLLVQGYSYKIEAQFGATVIYFEPDEERTFRALLSEETAAGSNLPPVDLLQATAEALTEILK